MTDKRSNGRRRSVALIFSIMTASFLGITTMTTLILGSGATAASAFAHDQISPFRIVIDGGSTGSRLHIFEFITVAGGSDDTENENSEEAAQAECVRRGSEKANVPLSAFGRTRSQLDQDVLLNATHVAQHLLPLFEYAATIIPSRYHATTGVTYQATAGMRLLPLEEQEAVYDALWEGLVSSPTFLFSSLKRSDIATLSGELEGLYGAVATNYLKGVIDANLNTIPESHELHGGLLGALDMGGSSTQIVFLPNTNSNEQQPQQQQGEETRSYDDDCEEYCVADYDDNEESSSSPSSPQVVAPTSTGAKRQEQQQQQPDRLKGDDFFSTSYLSYGVDQFRERLWRTWIQERKQQEIADELTCSDKMIENPCTFKGYEIEFEGYILLGTGNAAECQRQVRRLIPHHNDVVHNDHIDNPPKEASDSERNASVLGQVGGVQHPPVRGKFYAMSLFYFSLDSLRHLSHHAPEAHEALNLAWPNPSIQELENALDGLCKRSWEGDLETVQHYAHAYTRAEVLPHRCMESVYMVTLLKDGYGFDPTSRDITFSYKVDGSEVEWSLGMALSMYAQEKEQQQAATSTTSPTAMDEQQEVEEKEKVNVTRRSSTGGSSRGGDGGANVNGASSSSSSFEIQSCPSHLMDDATSSNARMKRTAAMFR